MVSLNASSHNKIPMDNPDSSAKIKHQFPNLEYLSKTDLKEKAETKNKLQKKALKDAQELYQNHQFKESKALFAKMIQYNKNDIIAHYYLSMIAAHYQKWDEVLVHLDYVIPYIRSEKRAIQLKQLKAYILIVQKKYKKAQDILESLKTYKNSNHLSILSMLAFIHHKTKNLDQAHQYYQQLISMNEKYANGYNGIGMIFFEKGEYKQAIQWCEKALKLNPNSPTYLDSVGYAYHKLGNTSKAIDHLKAAYELDPNNKDIKQHLNAALQD